MAGVAIENVRRGGLDAVVLMGPPGSGKSFLGNRLDERGVAAYRELEPVIRERFGTGAAFESRIREVGAFLWRSYAEQLSDSARPIAFESAGIVDRALLERLQRDHQVALVHVVASRAVCIERVVSRSPVRNISHTTDRDAIGRHYDLWVARILPSYRIRTSVDGEDAERAISQIARIFDPPEGMK